MATNTPDQHQTFSQKVWIAGGILSFIAVFLLLLKATFGVLLLILAGVLVAVFLRGLSGLLQRKTRWREGLCVTLSIVGTLSFVVLLFWLMGAKITGQVSQLTDTLPKTVENAKQYLNQSPLGQKLVERFSSPGTAKKAQGLAQTAFKSTFGVLGDLYAVLFLGIFFTVSPLAYKKGLIQLVPPKGQPKAAEVMAKLSENLTKWLKGKLFAMLVVFLLTAIGLVLRPLAGTDSSGAGGTAARADYSCLGCRPVHSCASS
jgi:predicted PurR-regulated permease PerM